MATSAAHVMFRAIHSLVDCTELDATEPWMNTVEGYFQDVVIHNFNVPAGTLFKFKQLILNRVDVLDREGMIVTTSFGNICVFERFHHGRDNIVVANMPLVVAKFLQAVDKQLTPYHIRAIFGHSGEVIVESDILNDNIGKRLDRLLGVAETNIGATIALKRA